MARGQQGLLEMQPGKPLMESFEMNINEVLNDARSSVGKRAQTSLKGMCYPPSSCLPPVSLLSLSCLLLSPCCLAPSSCLSPVSSCLPVVLLLSTSVILLSLSCLLLSPCCHPPVSLLSLSCLPPVSLFYPSCLLLSPCCLAPVSLVTYHVVVRAVLSPSSLPHSKHDVIQLLCVRSTFPNIPNICLDIPRYLSEHSLIFV